MCVISKSDGSVWSIFADRMQDGKEDPKVRPMNNSHKVSDEFQSSWLFHWDTISRKTKNKFSYQGSESMDFTWAGNPSCLDLLHVVCGRQVKDFFFLNNLCTQHEAWTHNPQHKSLKLHWLNHPDTPRACELKCWTISRNLGKTLTNHIHLTRKANDYLKHPLEFQNKVKLLSRKGHSHWKVSKSSYWTTKHFLEEKKLPLVKKMSVNSE